MRGEISCACPTAAQATEVAAKSSCGPAAWLLGKSVLRVGALADLLSMGTQAEAHTAEAMSTCGDEIWLSCRGGALRPRLRRGVHEMLRTRPVRSKASLNVKPNENHFMWRSHEV